MIGEYNNKKKRTVHIHRSTAGGLVFMRWSSKNAYTTISNRRFDSTAYFLWSPGSLVLLPVLPLISYKENENESRSLTYIVVLCVTHLSVLERSKNNAMEIEKRNDRTWLSWPWGWCPTISASSDGSGWGWRGFVRGWSSFFALSSPCSTFKW